MGWWSRRTGLCLAVLLVSHTRSGDGATCYGDVWTREDYDMCRVVMNGTYALHWKIDGNEIQFGLVVDGSYTWIGLGISEGGMKAADIMVVKTEKNIAAGSAWTVGDYWTNEFMMPVMDTQQDASIVRPPIQQHLVTVAEIRRRLDTCDPQDNKIYYDTDQNFIFAYGNVWDPLRPQESFHGANRDQVRIRLNPSPKGFNSTLATNDTASYYLNLLANDPPDLTRYEYNMLNYRIPTNRSSFTCQLFEFNSHDEGNPMSKRHIIRFEPIVENPDLVYHMLLTACVNPMGMPANESELPLGGKLATPFECLAMPPNCTTLMAMYAPGSGAVSFPLDVAVPVGEGAARFLMLQVHYHNPTGIAKRMDNSGFALQLTAQLRPNEAGWMMLGSRTWGSIPTGGRNFTVPGGICTSDCTSSRLPPQGVNMGMMWPYMRKAGMSIITRHVRNGTELQPVGFRKSFTDRYQYPQTVLPESRALLPGDALITECTYNTTGLAAPVPVGPTADMENCFNAVLVWPPVPAMGECTSAANMTANPPGSTAVGVCGPTPAVVATSAWFTNPAALLPAGLAVLTNTNLAYTPYNPVCSTTDKEVRRYNTGGAIAAIVVSTLVMVLLGWFVYSKWGRLDDPDRKALLEELSRQMRAAELANMTSAPSGEPLSTLGGASGYAAVTASDHTSVPSMGAGLGYGLGPDPSSMDGRSPHTPSPMYGAPTGGYGASAAPYANNNGSAATAPAPSSSYASPQWAPYQGA